MGELVINGNEFREDNEDECLDRLELDDGRMLLPLLESKPKHDINILTGFRQRTFWKCKNHYAL